MKITSQFTALACHSGIRLRRTPLAALIICLLGAGHAGYAEEIHFNPRMLGIAGANDSSPEDINLDYFSRKGGQTPGSYLVDIWFNGEFQETRTLHFVDNRSHPGELRAQLTPAMLKDLGIHLPETLKDAPADENLPEELSHYVLEATERLDVAKLRYELTVPQADMDARAQGSVDPALWDEGINAMMLNYTWSGSRSEDLEGEGTSSDNFLGIHSGINLGPWRLRYEGSLTDSHSSSGDDTETDESKEDDHSDNGAHWDSISTYVQRDVRFLQGGQLTLGQYSTPASVFDSFQFTGAQLASDDDMLPDSMSQFAPVIRGVAQSSAQVTVRQNGGVIYQTYVSPGPFAIRDLYSSGGGGDLQVSVKESDGHITQFTVPYTSLAVLQREGRMKYSLTGGKYRSGYDNTQAPQFIQGTASVGLAHEFTLYGGVNYAKGYQATGIGLGKDMGRWGAIAVDASRAKSSPEKGLDVQGTAYRAQYEKTVDTTGTDLRLAGYHYTRNYFNFSDAQDYGSDDGSDLDRFNRTHVKKDKLQVTISQPIGDLGSLSLSGSQSSYHDEPGQERNWQVSWNGSIWGVSTSLSWSYTRNPGDTEADEVLALNMSVPLDRFLNSNNSMWASYSMNTNRHGDTTHQAGISGNALEDSRLTYSVMQGYGNHGEGVLGNANMDYKGGSGETNLGYSYDSSTRQVNAGASGGVLVHGNGITFSQYMDDTVALVKAPGAGNVRVLNNNGVSTDQRGYTVVPYLQPYRRGRVELDTRTFGEDVDVGRTVDKVVPTKGAVVLADFETHIGRRALINLIHNGKPVPFGADAEMKNADTRSLGTVGDAGQVYLTGLPDQGDVMIQWGAQDKCTAHYVLPVGSGAENGQVPVVNANCQ